MLPAARETDCRSDALESSAMRDKTGRASIVDPREFARFVVTGIIATIGNMTAVAVALNFTSYQIAVIVGIAVGASISFPLAKILAFQSRDWRDARTEMPRFVLVYAIGVSISWLVSMAFGHGVLLRFLPLRQAELLGALIGAGTCTVTNYLGHRFYTYRGTRRTAADKP
jgi:putative flippase GtrA